MSSIPHSSPAANDRTNSPSRTHVAGSSSSAPVGHERQGESEGIDHLAIEEQRWANCARIRELMKEQKA